MLNCGFLLDICVTGLGWFVCSGEKFGGVFMLLVFLDVCGVLLGCFR